MARQSSIRAVGAGNHGSELVRKLQRLRSRWLPGPTHANRVLELLDWRLQRALGRSIRVRMFSEAHLPPVFTDSTQLVRVLTQLALFACNGASQGGGLTISAAARRVTDTRPDGPPEVGDYIVFCVCGHAAAAIPSDSSSADAREQDDAPEPADLRLAYRFASRSQGHLSIESDTPKGRRSELYLPCAGRSRQRRAARQTILVVEDDRAVLDRAMMLIGSLGYAVLVAQTPDDALRQLAASDSVDLMFIDLVLGGGASGDELAQEAQQLRPKVSVVLTTGYEERADIVAAQGRYPVLRKPYRREDLASALRGALNGDGKTPSPSA